MLVPERTTSRESAAKPAPPCTMVIFGGAGDLTKRKLIPALCNLLQTKLLPSQFAVVAVSVDDLDTAKFRTKLSEEIREFATSPVAPEQWSWLLERIHYIRGDFQDAATFEKLKEQMASLDASAGTQGCALFYLAVSPKFISAIIRGLGSPGLSREENDSWRRVII